MAWPMAWPTYSRTTLNPAASATRLHRVADVADAVAGHHLGDAGVQARPRSRRSAAAASGVMSPTPMVKAASPCQPSMMAPQSIEMMSPSRRRSVVGDAVHDHVVRRGADHRREAVVAEEVRAWRPGGRCTSRPMASSSRVVTPGRDGGADALVHLGHDPSGPAHDRDLGRRCAAPRPSGPSSSDGPQTVARASTASMRRSSTSSGSPSAVDRRPAGPRSANRRWPGRCRARRPRAAC